MSIVVLGAKNSSSFWPTAIGAVIGGGVSLVTTLLVERQKRKAADERDRQRLLADAELAARVVILELRDVESVLRVSLERDPFRWPPTPGYSFSTKAWDEHGGHLGTVLPDPIWDAVSVPYSTYAYSNLFGNVSHATAQEMLDQTENAIDALENWRVSLRTE
jgi:hypothetical protein